MEIEGHPTVDLITELVGRGAVLIPGSSSGPDPDIIPVVGGVEERGGQWLFLPNDAFRTGLDEVPE
ncbi:MAG: hypothetical protein H0V60_09605 [Actinobacteria bacterium]|nr:hypothetical protein [Actinomycetota bacterium]